MTKSPQLEDGYTTIANEIIEALARINLSAYEQRVMMAIFRKTYGWHKKQDRISYSQFEELTGLNRRHVGRAIRSLQSRLIITTTGNGYRLRYGLQKDYSKWGGIRDQSLPQSVTIEPIVTSTGTHSLPKEATKSLPKSVTTKERKKLNKRKGQLTFDEYEQELRSQFTDIDFTLEMEKFWLYWSEGSRQLKRPKLALLNWMTRAREYNKEKGVKQGGKARGHTRNIGDRTRYNRDNY